MDQREWVVRGERERERVHTGTKRDEKETATIRLSVFIRVAPVIWLCWLKLKSIVHATVLSPPLQEWKCYVVQQRHKQRANGCFWGVFVGLYMICLSPQCLISRRVGGCLRAVPLQWQAVPPCENGGSGSLSTWKQLLIFMVRPAVKGIIFPSRLQWYTWFALSMSVKICSPLLEEEEDWDREDKRKK